MSTARNDLCSCAKSGAWRSRREASRALEYALDHPRPEQLYLPTGIVRCRAGIYHLTSKAGKPWKSGKGSRRRAR